MEARSSHGATAEINSEQLLSKTSKGNDSKEKNQTACILLLPARKSGSHKFTETSNENTTGIFPLAEKSKMAIWKERQGGLLNQGL